MERDLFRAGVYFTLFQILQGLHIPLSDKFHTEITSADFLSSSSGSRTKRDTTNEYLPKNTVLRLVVAGSHQHIPLKKNHKIDISNIPVYITNNGRIERIHTAFDKEHVLYQAPTIGGSFLVTCHKNETSITREIFGSFHHNSSLYVIQPEINGGVKGEGHVISRVPDQTLVFEGVSAKGLPATTSRPNFSRSYHGNRRTRRQTDTYNIELLSVIDYKSYQFWYDMTSGSDRSGDTMNLVMQYIAYIINSVDMRYKTVTGANRVFNVLSAGIYIADSAQSSPWSENNNVNGQVPSSATLDSFRDWVNDQNSLPAYDHAMGFTGYDVVSAGSGDSSGIAYTSVLCTSDSTSVVEDSFNFITMTTVAHELGHSLGAVHDGQGNTCSGSDNYIMASVNNIVGDPNIGQNIWKFSPCTGQEFQTYINILDGRGDNCLLTTSSSSNIPTTPRPMAESYSADQTCVYRFGVGSYVCRSIQNYETICTSMFCNQPGTSQCYSTIPAEGTPCGQGKWCEQGRCVTSARAPSNNADNCALGDRPGLFDTTGQTCAQRIEENKSLCYGDYTGSNCCESCNAKRTGDASCQYGDHGTGFCTSMPRYGCYTNEEYCCGTCKPLKNNALPGCEFGDRFNGCLRAACAQYNAENLAGCCETCYDPANTVKTTTASSTTSTPVPTTTPTPTTTTSTTSTPTTTTPTTTTSTTPTAKTTAPTTTTIKTTQSTTKATSSSAATPKPTTSKPGSTTEYPGTPGSSTTGMESTETPVEKPGSDLIFVIAGCLAGAIIVIVFVIILCVCLRKRAKRAATSGGRKPSKDNAYDNIGFVRAASEKPHHPPPRRTSSHSASGNNASNGSAHIPISTIANGSTVVVYTIR
ncbi:disintegrin and metalloproteinase domain-containing protein 1b-like isoform X3 [Ruditapes philippinarum]|uniref:disintegrin and metalloproteinase domain-containing protein 1b-like isoform X3 n=1 Tax=Ruditapes philippinarum TaxID=129788 RepID=UPI00295B74E3|nr:disintegrin and metalloproteinase domain-containing protein 1b-like isoform X3 [Ruditapes philippinarum]